MVSSHQLAQIQFTDKVKSTKTPKTSKMKFVSFKLLNIFKISNSNFGIIRSLPYFSSPLLLPLNALESGLMA